MTDEPRITINGVEMSPGAAMTIRVALESFALDLTETGLGDDKHGRGMTKAYLERIGEIRAAIFKKVRPEGLFVCTCGHQRRDHMGDTQHCARVGCSCHSYIEWKRESP